MRLDFIDFNRVEYEEAVCQTQFGKFHYYLLAICGLIYLNTAVGITIISFVLPSATCGNIYHADSLEFVLQIVFEFLLQTFRWHHRIKVKLCVGGRPFYEWRKFYNFERRAVGGIEIWKIIQIMFSKHLEKSLKFNSEKLNELLELRNFWVPHANELIFN